MTVAEAITELQKCDPNALIVVPLWAGEEERWGWKKVEVVEGEPPDVYWTPSPDNPEHGSVGSMGQQLCVTIW